jgi:hypothetical protein
MLKHNQSAFAEQANNKIFSTSNTPLMNRYTTPLTLNILSQALRSHHAPHSHRSIHFHIAGVETKLNTFVTKNQIECLLQPHHQIDALYMNMQRLLLWDHACWGPGWQRWLA